MQSIVKNINGINITVDYRTELLGILMWLSGYTTKLPHLFSEYENKFYTDEIVEKFSKYKNEEVVLKFKELVDKHNFSYDAPFALFLQLDEHFKCDNLDDYTFKERLQHDESVYEFTNGLEDFAKKINFNDYYNSKREMYEQWIDSMSGLFETYDLTNFYENYFGQKSDKSFNVLLMPYTTDGSYACTFDNAVYDCFPVFKSMKKDDLFHPEKENYKYAIGAPVHEFAHSFINPITEKLDLLNYKTNFFDDIRDVMAQQAYETDDYIINEHLVRAVVIRFYNNIVQDKGLVDYYIQDEENRGFVYIKPILEKLEEYEDNRDKYPNFEKLYPEIINSIKNYKKGTNNNKQR